MISTVLYSYYAHQIPHFWGCPFAGKVYCNDIIRVAFFFIFIRVDTNQRYRTRVIFSDALLAVWGVFFSSQFLYSNPHHQRSLSSRWAF